MNNPLQELMHVIDNENISIIKSLLIYDKKLINKKHGLFTPLTRAITLKGPLAENKRKMLTTLFNAGADPNAHFQFAPILFFFLYRNDGYERAKLLLKHGANPFLTNKEGQNAFEYAKKASREIQDLLKHYATRTD